MEDKFVGRVGRSDILRAITLLALLACIVTIGVSAGWLYPRKAITIEKLERSFEATRHYLENGGNAFIRFLNQPLPIRVASPALENAESPQDARLEIRPLEPFSSGDTKKQNKRRHLAIGGALLLILIVLDRWRNRSLKARSSAAHNSVRIPSPILTAHLAGHRTPVDDRSHVTEYKTAKIH